MSMNTSSSSTTATTKPKRPLSAYNLFYRFKRAKIVEASNSGNDGEDAILQLVMAVPGLEDYDSSTLSSTMSQDEVATLSRSEIRGALLTNLSPNETRKRTHRKSHGAMSFLEMNKAMVASWKSIDDTTRAVFEELAEIGRRQYHKRVADYNDQESSSMMMSMKSEESPKKKMKMMPMEVPHTSGVEKLVHTPPTVVPSMVESSTSTWNSVRVDEIDMQRKPSTTTAYKMVEVPSATESPLFKSRRVSLESTYDDVLCVTAPMKFPEARTREEDLIVDFPKDNFRGNDDSLLVDFPSAGNHHSSTTYTDESPRNTIDLDKLDLDDSFMFDLSEDDRGEMMDCDYEKLPSMPFNHSSAMKSYGDEADLPAPNTEPSVDDFLKLISQLEESMPQSERALAA